eukprot:5874666-Pleurochrysis_carterae.AAC.2
MKAINTSNTPHVAKPCGRLRRVSAARANLRPTAWAPSRMACHRLAARACIDGCEDSRISAAITVYDSRGCLHMMRLALVAMSLVICHAAIMVPMPDSASCSAPNSSKVCACPAANATSVIVAVMAIHLVVEFFDCARPGTGWTVLFSTAPVSEKI